MSEKHDECHDPFASNEEIDKNYKFGRGRCPRCGAPDCGNNLGIYLCGSRGSIEWGTLVESEYCRKIQKVNMVADSYTESIITPKVTSPSSPEGK
jgi:hypothetical protein